MAARLFCKTGETRGLELELASDREVVVGRDPTSDLVIERPLMSSRHARIFYDAGAERFVLEDLESLNGTELDGDQVSGSERLGHLHVITFAGSYDFFFQDPERTAQRHPEPVAPAREARATPVAAPSTAGAVPAEPSRPGDPDDVTAIESEPVGLPGILARRADAIDESAAGRIPASPDITSLDLEPVALPDVLARRADQARPDEPTADEPMADEPAADRPTADETLREKLPVGLPGVLAKRAEEATGGKHQPNVQKPNVQKHKTVDLADIEELIASEEVTEAGEREAHLIEGLHLIVTESGGRVRRYPLVEGENLIGRGTQVQVALKYPDLSRRHARLTVASDQVTLRDLGSRNRTFVDDKPIEPEVDVEVAPGARLRFGSVEARLAKVGG